MKNFKDCYMDDVENAFFDEDEFAERHTIDGKECSVILTDVSVQNAKMSYGLMKSTLNPKENAIGKHKYLLCVKEQDLRKKLTVNATIVLDGKKLFVQNVSKNDGIYRLELGTYAV